MASPLVCAAQTHPDLRPQQQRQAYNLQRQKAAHALLYFAASGDVQRLEQVLNSNLVHPDQPDREGNTSLIWASAKAHLQCVTLLVDKYRANVAKMNQEGETALFVAVREGHSDVARWLLQNGADPNTSTVQGLFPLHAASALGRQDLVQLLLDFGAWLECQDLEGETPLFHGVRENRAAVVALLLQRGADPRHANEDGETPSDLAREVATDAVVALFGHFLEEDAPMADSDETKAHAASGVQDSAALDADVHHIGASLERMDLEDSRRSLASSSSMSIPYGGALSSSANAGATFSPSASPSASSGLTLPYQRAGLRSSGGAVHMMQVPDSTDSSANNSVANSYDGVFSVSDARNVQAELASAATRPVQVISFGFGASHGGSQHLGSGFFAGHYSGNNMAFHQPLTPSSGRSQLLSSGSAGAPMNVAN